MELTPREKDKLLIFTAALLAERRRQAFAAKWRFNRTLRLLVTSPQGVGAAAAAARLVPSLFASIIRYAGDCRAS